MFYSREEVPDYMDCLLRYLYEEILPHVWRSPDYLNQEEKRAAAFQAMKNTFSEEQSRLYLTFEAEQNLLLSMNEELIFHAAFALGRAIYR